jgi:hypothetical protein
MTGNDESNFLNRPFSERLAKGESRMTILSFELSVLQIYRDDPRYSYNSTDFSGNISVASEFIDSEQIRKEDEVFLQTFGFSYDENFNRAVCVYLIYLSRLPAEHQQIWSGKLLSGNYRPHPDYVRSSRYGLFPEGISVFDAVCHEISFINEISLSMSRPHLFKFSPNIEDKPNNFSFLVRPTKKELNDFIHTLDKLLSDNIDRKFFGNDVNHTIEIERKDGKIVVEQKGTIQILEDWLNNFLKEENQTVSSIIAAFKKVRSRRQPIAHKIDENIFNQSFFQEQRAIIKECHDALTSLRLILQKSLTDGAYSIPKRFENLKIWTY